MAVEMVSGVSGDGVGARGVVGLVGVERRSLTACEVVPEGLAMAVSSLPAAVSAAPFESREGPGTAVLLPPSP